MRRIRLGCCDQLVRGHDTAAVLASSVRKSRRFLSNMELPAPWVTATVERPGLHEVIISYPPGVDFSAQCRAQPVVKAEPPAQNEAAQKSPVDGGGQMGDVLAVQ